jgi:hypothetical protein
MTYFVKAGRLAAASALCVAGPAYAKDADTSLALGAIIVTARSSGMDAPPTTVDRMGGDIAQRAPVLYLWQ